MEISAIDQNPNMVYVMLYEAIGTCIFTFGINMSVDFSNNFKADPMSVGLLYFVNICFLGVLSGGHFNPAVSLGVLIKEGRQRWKTNTKYFFMIISA